MSEDELLRKLGQVARDEAGRGPTPLDELWERLAAGTASADEEAELRRLAETSEDARAAYEAFRPLGADFQARVARAIESQAGGGAESRVAAAPAVKRGAGVLPFPRTARRLAVWGAAMGAAAAAMVGILVRPPALPTYAVAELSGGASATRGEAPARITELAPGDRFHAVLRPATAVRRGDTLRAEAYLLRHGELRRLVVENELDSQGSVRLTATLDTDLAAGNWTLWLVVGRRGALPDPADLRTSSAGGHRTRNWVALPTTLLIQPRPLE